MVKKLPLRGRFCLGNLPSFILIVVFSVLIFIGMGLFSETYTDFYFASCFNNPVLIILNFAPILLLMLFVYAITANSPFSIAFTGILFLSMGLINNFKILYRDDPFVISDLGLGRELVGILGGFDFRLMVMALGGIILIVIILFLLLYLFRGAKLKWWLRLTICLLCVAASASLYFGLYSDDELYDNLPVEGSIYCKYDQYSSKGWTYCFIYEAKKLVIKAPEGYNAAEYKNYESASVSSKQYDGAVKPHVIMIMSEAFTDLSENEYLDFSGYRDPIANYKAIAADAVVSGHVAVDVYGGGTATTEFEVLSAIDVDAFDTSTSPYNLIRKDFYALPGIMKDLGYDTAALHPGDGWFYNRDNVYRYMGFDDFLNLGNGVDEDAEKKGEYVSEAATYDYLLSLLSPRLSADRDPLFEFCVTIQNHGGYALKYGNLPPNFTTTANLGDAALNQLTNYFHGVIDADEELGDFIDSIKDSSEPVVWCTGGIIILLFREYMMKWAMAISITKATIQIWICTSRPSLFGKMKQQRLLLLWQKMQSLWVLAAMNCLTPHS